MIYKNTRFSKTLNVLVGALVFALGTSAGTFYLQDTLFVFIQFNSYAHWAVVLIGLPIVMGLIQRLIKIVYPLFSTLIGTLISAAVLYPLYGSRFWAEPPQLLDMLIYILIVSGIGFLASQPLRTTFLAAFRIKRSAPAKTTKTSKPAAANKSSAKKVDGTRTQRVSRPASSDRSASGVPVFLSLTSISGHSQ